MHSVCQKFSSCVPGTMRIPAHWGCPLGGAPAAATAASYTGTPAAVQSLPFLFPCSPWSPWSTKHKLTTPLCSIIPPLQRTSNALPQALEKGTPLEGLWWLYQRKLSLAPVLSPT